jgi:hypothetical protein
VTAVEFGNVTGKSRAVLLLQRTFTDSRKNDVSLHPFDAAAPAFQLA